MPAPITYPPTNTANLRVKLGRVATGTMTAGSNAITGLGFSALPWEGSGPPLMPSDVGNEITVIGAGPTMPVVPPFGPHGEMIVGILASWTSATSGTLFITAANDTQVGAANVVIYRDCDYRFDSVRVEKSLTSITRSTFSFEVVSRNGSMVCIEGMPVLLTDNVLGDLWGGAVDTVDIVDDIAIPGSPLTFKVTCVSWAHLLERRPINPYVLNGGIFTGQTLQYIARHLVYDYCDSEGLSVNSVVGPTLDLNVSGTASKTVAAALDEATAQASDPNNTYIWTVNPWRVVTVQKAEATPAPWHVSDVDGSTSNILLSVNYRRTRSKLANAVYLWCTAVLRDTPDETYSGDASKVNFTTVKPIGKTPVIMVNGIAKSVGFANGTVTYDWYWSQGSNTIEAAVAPAMGATVVVSYKAQSSELFMAFNDDSIDTQLRIESGTGQWFTRMEYALPINEEDCQALTQSFADRLSEIPKELTLTTMRSGLDIGQSMTVTLNRFALAATGYLIDTLTMTTESGYMKWEAHCVNGPAIGDYLSAFAVMSGTGGGGTVTGGFGGGGGGGTTLPGTGVTVVELDIVASGTISGPDPAVGGLLVLYLAVDGIGGQVVTFDLTKYRWPPDVDTTPNLAITAIFASVDGKWTYLPVNGRRP